MLTLLNKKNILAYAISSLVFTGNTYAALLNVDGNSTAELTGAEHVNVTVLTDADIQHEPHSSDYTFLMNGTERSGLSFQVNGTLDLFMNDWLLNQEGRHGGQWLLIHRACDISRKIEVVAKPGHWYVAFAKDDCPPDANPGGLTVTFLKTNRGSASNFKITPYSPEKPDINLSPEFSALSKSMMLFDSADSSTLPLAGDGFLNSHQMAQADYLANPNHYEPLLTTVNMLNIPITGSNLQHAPGGALLNQLIQNSDNIVELLDAIVTAWNNQPGITKLNLQALIKAFEEAVVDANGKVNSQKVFNFIKEQFKKYKEEGTPKSVLIGMVSALIESILPPSTPTPETFIPEFQPEGAVGGVGISDITPPDVEVHTDSNPAFELAVQQLITATGHNVNHIASSIMRLVPACRKKKYARLKDQLRNQNGGLNTGAVTLLLRGVDKARIEKETEIVNAMSRPFEIKKRSKHK